MSRKAKEIFMGLFTKKHSIGKTIAELRKEKGWTQIELAEKLQVSDKGLDILGDTNAIININAISKFNI